MSADSQPGRSGRMAEMPDGPTDINVYAKSQIGRRSSRWDALRWGQRPGGPSLSRATFLRAGAVAVGAALSPSWAGTAVAQPADAVADDALHVDPSDLQGSPNYVATGFLHGLSQDGSQPPDDLLNPLKPRLFRGGGSSLPGGGWARGGHDGYAPRWQTVVDRYHRVAPPPIGANYAIVMSDLWGAEGVTLATDDPYPGDNGDWTSYESFVAQVVHDAKAADMDPDKIQYEIWNEPDYTTRYFPRTKEQYEEMWQRGVRLIRRLDPRARIEGPTFTGIRTTGTAWRMNDFLDMAKATDTMPDILSWHALGRSPLPSQECDLARQLLAERGLRHLKLEMNEYGPSDGLVPGYQTWYVIDLQRSGLDYSAMGIYTACCVYPYLDGLVTYAHGYAQPTSLWWIYQRYASLTGNLLKTTAGSFVDGIAAADPHRRQLRVLLGNSKATVGQDSDLGTVRVTIGPLGSAHSYLLDRGRIQLRLERVPDSAILEHTDVLYNTFVTPTRNKITVDIPWHQANAAYVITLGNQDSKLPPYIIVAANPPGLVMLPEWPQTTTIHIRNYTDKPVTLPVTATAPSGYDVDSPTSVDLAATCDSQVAITVTRTTTDMNAENLSVKIGDLSTTVPLQPSADWVRVATMTASSTHAPSSPENLNDGNTDTTVWGGGGAGGWNDDTASTFPDWVTATWSKEVTLARATIYTLNSPTYPASAYGVRDYDLQTLDANANWQTVAQIRGNTAGMITSTFPAVNTTALRILITDSNDHTYSRLIAIQGYDS